jgi:hypothetical protein
LMASESARKIGFGGAQILVACISDNEVVWPLGLENSGFGPDVVLSLQQIPTFKIPDLLHFACTRSHRLSCRRTDDPTWTE